MIYGVYLGDDDSRILFVALNCESKMSNDLGTFKTKQRETFSRKTQCNAGKKNRYLFCYVLQNGSIIVASFAHNGRENEKVKDNECGTIVAQIKRVALTTYGNGNFETEKWKEMKQTMRWTN